MSSCEWTEPGYGFKLFNGSNLETVKNFILSNISRLQPSSSRSVNDFINAKTTDVAEEALDYPLSWAVAEIINDLEATNMFKGYKESDDTDQPAMLGIEPLYPWQTVQFSQPECDTLLKKYGERLGISETPDFFSAAYYG